MIEIPLGFRFAAGYAGIRKKDAEDVALIVSDQPAAAAGVFTRSQVRAPAVTVSERHLRASGGVAHAIVCNAGNANCSAPGAEEAVRRTVHSASKLAKCAREGVLVASTGVIGEPLDHERLTNLLPLLWDRAEPGQFEDCARAIMTTDTVPKIASTTIETAAGTVRLAGMAKGSGMIMPDMATMLAFLFTDADIRPAMLQRLLREAVDETFNCISVDSDTSTNDCVFLLASGASGLKLRRQVRRDPFRMALRRLCQDLAMAIVRDGEGARKLLTIYVDGAANDHDARQLARAIANSPLVKTAFTGSDPNWGRIMAAAGKAGVVFDPNKVEIVVNGRLLCSRGQGAFFSESDVRKTLEGPESVLRFHIDGRGRGQARYWTCDLTEDYIKINAEYRT